MIVPGTTSLEYGVHIPHSLYYAYPPDKLQELVSPEEIVIQRAFGELAITHPNYLDIGAHDPLVGSNTYLLYLQGSQGINVEPNPDYEELWKYHRADDINLPVGIGVKSGMGKYYEIEGKPQLNTFSPKELYKAMARGHELRKVSNVAVLSLPDLIHTYSNGVFPDLMSIDIEGLDEDILRTMPEVGTTRPKVVCAETLCYTDTPGEGVRNTDLIDMMIRDGFEVFDETDYNSIFIRP